MTHVLLQAPAGEAAQLILLLAPTAPEDLPRTPPADPAGALWALGRALAGEYPSAWVIGLPAAGPDDEDAAVLTAVRGWQRHTGVAAAATLLVGQGDGAARALAAVHARDGLVGRVVAIDPAPSPETPGSAPRLTTLHLVHALAGEPARRDAALDLAERLASLGADLTADILPADEPDPGAAVTGRVIERLRGYLPRRTWDEALLGLNRATGAGSARRSTP
jgi:hypothetical protein